MKKILILSWVYGLFLFSCQIKEPPVTRTDLLTTQVWFVAENSAASVKDCEKDDPVDFRDDGTLIVLIEAGTPCDPGSGIERLTVFWKFYKENQFIWLVGEELDTLVIHELNEDILKLEKGGEILTFKH